MKINLAKLLTVISHIVVAAPIIAAAVKPVIDGLRKPSAP